jgi:Flp pilus assembly protein TadG
MALTKRLKERGAVAIEMALVAPFLLLLVLGMVDVGRLLFTYVSVVDAAHEGAMYAAFEPCDLAAVKGKVISSQDDLSLDSSNVSVAPQAGYIDVTVDVDVDILTPLISSIIGDTVSMDKKVSGTILTDDAC